MCFFHSPTMRFEPQALHLVILLKFHFNRCWCTPYIVTKSIPELVSRMPMPTYSMPYPNTLTVFFCTCTFCTYTRLAGFHACGLPSAEDMSSPSRGSCEGAVGQLKCWSQIGTATNLISTFGSTGEPQGLQESFEPAWRGRKLISLKWGRRQTRIARQR